jgi:hypothetical protein
VPFAEGERLPRADDDGQRRHRAALAQRAGEISRVVFPAHRPAEGEARGREAGERALQVGVDALRPARERRRVDPLA